MKLLSLFLLLFPVSLFAQTSSSKIISKAKEGYVINGEVKGFADGVPVSFLNQQTNAPEQQATVKNGKFIIKGKVKDPGFVVLMIDNNPPMVPIFLDNSQVQIKVDKNDPDHVLVSGSKSHDEFVMFSNAIRPYEKIFSGEDYDPAAITNITGITESFVSKFPASYVSPFAIVRYMQATQDGANAEKMFNTLSPVVKHSDISLYLGQLIQESKINPLGSIMQDFVQDDVTGKPVSLASLKGKYLLIDFWASWCRPCRAENPNVVAAYNKFKDKNFNILGVSLDKAKPAWVDAIRMDNLNWSQVSDLQGWNNAAAQKFQIHSIPQNFLLDPQGRIIAKNLRGPALDKRLESLLK